MKVKTSAAVGCILDWAATKSANIELPKQVFLPNDEFLVAYFKSWSPSTRYEQGGPLLELFGVSTECLFPGIETAKEWVAKVDGENRQRGHTFLIAGMRALAAVHFGDEIEVPQFMLEADI